MASVIVAPMPTAGAVDRGDHRLGAVVDRERHAAAGVAHARLDRGVVEPVPHVLQRRPLGLVEAEDVAFDGQVHAGAERPAAAGHHDGAHVVVAAGAVEGVDELVGHRRR